MSDNARQALSSSAIIATEITSPDPEYGAGHPSFSFEGVDKEIEAWATPQLLARLHDWSQYESVMEVPQTLSELNNGYPNFAKALEQLHVAKRHIDSEVGEELELALIPWKYFYDNLSDLPTAMQRLRQAAPGNSLAASFSDTIHPVIIGAIEKSLPLYR